MKTTFTRVTSMLLLLLAGSLGFAQNGTQTLKGRLTDKFLKIGLPDGKIRLINAKTPLEAVSDGAGRYSIAGIPAGRYDVEATCEGYKPVVIENVLVTAGKEVVLEIEMEDSYATTTDVTITAIKKNETNNEMSTVSARSFTMEEVTRYSGGMSDPSRLAANFAGVVMPNDQRNDLVIRGNSPTGVLWRIDGLNIPNPNHFGTIGTTGGTLTILNNNVLRNSDFLTSAFVPEYGNAIAGVFDVGLRSGNSDRREHTIQLAAFSGIEAMTEGPIFRKLGASYLVAYRHTLTTVSQDAARAFGTAATPDYQDIAFKINGGNTRLGQFTLFGIGGKSAIDFLHNEIDTTDVFSDPTRDSYNTSAVGLLGLTHTTQAGKRAFVKTVLGGSITSNTFEQDTLTATEQPVRVSSLASREAHYSLNTTYTLKLKRFTLKTGAIGELLRLTLDYRDKEFTPFWHQIWDYDGQTALVQGFVQGRYSFSDKLILTGGVHSQHLTLNGSTSLEPRLAARWQLTEGSALTAAWGVHAQMQPLSMYFYNEPIDSAGSVTYDRSNRNLGFTNSQHFVVGYDFLPQPDWRIKVEAYYHHIYDVPVTTHYSSFSALNEGVDFAPTQQGFLINGGTGRNMGAELTLEKFFSKGYYGLITASLYDARYTGSNGIERNSAFNGRHTFNALAGREFKFRQVVFTLDTKFATSGGRWYTPVDLAASQAAGRQVLQSDAFSARYPTYFRWDVKAGVRINSIKRKLSHIFFVDFQNVTNHQNVFARRYNPVSNEIGTSLQTGFTPNVMYRVQF